MNGDKMGKAFNLHWEWAMRNTYILVRKPEGKRPLERPRRRWEDNFKMCLIREHPVSFIFVCNVFSVNTQLNNHHPIFILGIVVSYL
jgi:hypothetical protein